MDENFRKALEHTLRHEGVFSNHAWDPGGKTKYGVTERVWEAWKEENRRHGMVSIQDITPQMAEEVYYSEYWVSPGFHRVENPFVAMELFDTGVNCGTVTAIRCCQEAVNFLRKPQWESIAVDGRLGPVTRGAIKRLVDQGYVIDLLTAMNGEQYILYKKIGNQNAARGWAKRLRLAAGIN